MATEKQIRANRANAQKSTGPRTAAGRAKSARNSLRHGAFARAVVLDNESRARFEELWASLKKTFRPGNTIELSLVQNMAVARWHQMRIWAMERAAISSEIQKQTLEDPETASLDPAARAAVAYRALADNSRCLEAMSREENRRFNQFERALDRLTSLRRHAGKKVILPNEPN